VIYEIAPDGGGANSNNRVDFYYHIEKKHADYFKKHLHELQNHCQVAGVNCLKLNRKSEGVRLLWKGYWMNPKHIKSFFRAFKYTFRFR
jgi:hypothetical protein